MSSKSKSSNSSSEKSSAKISKTRRTIETKAGEKTPDKMTRIYQVPSSQFRTKEDVLQAFGYTLEKQLDKGGFGILYIAHDRRKNIKVACKWMDLGSKDETRMLDTRNELFAIEEVRHPHVIQLYCHFLVHDTTYNMYIFMQLAQGGNLYKYLQKKGLPDEELGKKYFAQILCGINHMHAYGIAHRDIKLQNILLVEEPRSISGQYLLCVSDFGTSTVVRQNPKTGANEMNKTICGSPYFMAPEMIDIYSQESKVDCYDAFQSDIWSLGITLFMILTLDLPFEFKGRELAAVSKDMKTKRWRWSNQLKTRPSPELNALLRSMLQSDPTKRIKLAKVIAHKWIASTYKAAHDLSDVIKEEGVSTPKKQQSKSKSTPKSRPKSKPKSRSN